MPVRTTSATHEQPVPLSSDRGLVWLGLATTTYTLAEYLLYVALPVWLLRESGSALAVGVSFILRILPAWAGPAVGSVVDRFPKRSMLVLAGVLGATMALPSLPGLGGRTTTAIYVASFGISVSSLVFHLARRSAVPELVGRNGERERLTRANSFLTVAVSFAQVLGATLGAIIVGRLAATAVVAMAVALYLAGGAFSWLVRATRGGSTSGGEDATVADVVRGVTGAASIAGHEVRPPGVTGPPGKTLGAGSSSDRVVLGVILLMGLEMLAAGPLIAYQVVFVERHMNLPPEFYGYLFSAQTAGCLVASTLLLARARKVVPGDVLPLSLGTLAATTVVLMTGHPFWAVASRFVAGMAISSKVIADDTLLQTYGESRRLARILALGGVSASVAETASIAAAGWLIPSVGIPATFWAAALLQACGAAAGLRVRGLAAVAAGRSEDRR